MEIDNPGNNPLPSKSSPVPQGKESDQPPKNSENLLTSKLSKPKTPKLVERCTALRASSISPPRTPQSSRRRDTLNDLSEPEPEIPYIKMEHAIRGLVCSLMERQDRMNEQLFLTINDMQYRVDDIDSRLREILPGYDPEEGSVTA